MKPLPESTLSHTDVRRAFPTVVDAELAGMRERLAQRMAAARQGDPQARFRARAESTRQQMGSRGASVAGYDEAAPARTAPVEFGVV